jgi:hypothetical protein
MNEREVSSIRKPIVTNPLLTVENQEILDWLSEAEMDVSETTWRTECELDYGYYAGKQDSQDVLNALAEQKRPNPVFNSIMSKVNMICGLSAQSNRAPYLYPVGSEDAALTELMNGAFKHYRRQGKLKRKENECFEHMAKTGRSFLHFYIDRQNPMKPRIKAARIDARNVWMDPKSVEYDMSDARFIFVDKWISEKDIQAMWPDLNTADIRNFSQSNPRNTQFYNTASDMYRITECWYRRYERIVHYKDPISGQITSASPMEFARMKKTLKDGVQFPDGRTIQSDQPIESYSTMEKKVYYQIFSGPMILEEGPSPYKMQDFPYFLFGGYKDDTENRWFGVISMMRDPQKSRNTIRRQLIHLLQTSPKGILVHEVGALLRPDDYAEHSSEPNFRLEVNKGYFEKLRFTDQANISPIYGQLDALFDQDMKDESGAQDSLLGIQTTGREPGITAKLRVDTGMAVLYMLFDNAYHSRINAAKFFMSLIQQYITYEDMIRTEQDTFAMVNSQNNKAVQGFNDITSLEFDIAIDEAVDNQTMRMQTAQLLTDIAHQNPGAIPIEIILEYSDLPLTTRQRVQQYQMEMMAREDAKFKAEMDLEREKIRATSAVQMRGQDVQKETAKEKAKEKPKPKKGGK